LTFVFLQLIYQKRHCNTKVYVNVVAPASLIQILKKKSGRMKKIRISELGNSPQEERRPVLAKKIEMKVVINVIFVK